MLERLVFCGGLKADAERPDALQLDVNAPAGSGKRINLQIEDISKRLADTIPDVLTDLLEIASYVYCADQFTRRGSKRMSGMGAEWRRRFHFKIPVRRPDVWSKPDLNELLVETLGFLSEDAFVFDFKPSERLTPLQKYLPFSGSDTLSTAPEEIILFSGGLDSLAGTSEALFSAGRRVALVSHRASTTISSKQDALVNELRMRADKGAIFHVPVNVNTGRSNATEFTQRTRSFLFATLAFIVARLFKRNEISFYENGVVSINLPIAEHVLGVRASRTTHPRFLSDCSRIFSALLSEDFRLRNPYVWKTKGEVVQVLPNNGCADLITETISCTRVRQATVTKKQCGLCSQCIDRRFGVLAAGLGLHDPPEKYAIDVFEHDLRPGPGLTMVESYIERAQRLANMPNSSFTATYGQIFRTLSHLPGSEPHNAKRVWELHQRHGLEVTGVIDQQLQKSNLSSLHPRSLAAMVVWPHAKGISFRDPIEKEPTAAVQAATDTHNYEPIQVRFALDFKKCVAVFNGGIEFSGSVFRLIAELFKEYEQDLNAETAHGDYSFVNSNLLAERLSIQPHSLRQRVLRSRRKIEDAFLSKFDRMIDGEDVSCANRCRRCHNSHKRLSQLTSDGIEFSPLFPINCHTILFEHAYLGGSVAPIISAKIS